MKDAIEKKLGCTIEQFFKKLADHIAYCRKNWLETEEPSGLEPLTPEEKEFVRQYAIEHNLKIV